MKMKFPVLPNPRSGAVVALLATAAAAAAQAIEGLVPALRARLRGWRGQVANDNEPGLGVAGARFRLI